MLANGSTVYIVSPRELGLVVRDVSVDDSSPNFVTGATVRIRSRFNDSVLEGVTDDSGTVSFDIGDLAEDEGKNATLPRYAFNATVEVSAQGYRDFRAGLMRMEGGTTLGIPTQPARNGIPYPASASFDEWDVLYTTGDAATFVSSTGNDADHAITIDLRDCPSDAPVAAELFCDGSSMLKTNTTSASDGTATISFTDAYLLAGSSQALPTGEEHAYALRYTVNGTTYEVPIKLGVTDAPPDAQSPQLKKDLSLTPFNADGFKLGFDVPKDCPLIGGSKLKLWEPQFPLWASFDPFGFLRFRATSPEFGYANVYGKPDKSGWQRVPRKSVKQQFTDAWDAMGNQTMETFNSMTRVNEDGKMNTFRQTSFAGKFTFMFQIEALAMATWDWGGKESRSRAQLAVRTGANYSLTETFWAGPIPVVIRFGIGLNMVAAGMAGFIGEHVWKPWDWRWDFTSTGFDLQLCFPPTLSVGVGIGGVCSISVRGTITVTFSLHYGPLPKGFEDREPVHLRLAASVGLNVEVEALFFTYSHKITGKDWPDWYDNWAEKSTLQTDLDDPLADGLKTAQPLRSLNEGKIITEGSLGALAEFETAGLASTAQVQALEPCMLVEQTFQGDVAMETPVAWLFMAPDAIQGDGTALTNGDNPQNDSQPTLVLKRANSFFATNDQIDEQPPAFVETREVGVRPIGNHSYAEVPQAPTDVLRLGLEQGFRPTIDVRMAENILASSHLKLFTVGANDYVARIGVVMVAGQPRTRIICETATGGDPRVLDFASNYRDDECYDFDIASTVVGGKEIVNLVVISGKREAGDATTFASAATKTFFSFVTCTDWYGRRTFAGTTAIGSAVDPFVDSRSYPFRNYSCPRLAQIKGTKNGVEYGQAAVAFLARAAKFEDEIMGTDPDLTRAAASMVFFADGDRTIDVTGVGEFMRPLAEAIVDPTITEISLSGRANGYQMLELKGTEQTNCALLETDPCWYVLRSGRVVPRLLGTTIIDLGDYAGKLTRLVPIEGGSYLLTCVDGMLKRADVVAGEGQTPMLTITGDDTGSTARTAVGYALAGLATLVAGATLHAKRK